MSGIYVAKLLSDIQNGRHKIAECQQAYQDWGEQFITGEIVALKELMPTYERTFFCE